MFRWKSLLTASTMCDKFSFLWVPPFHASILKPYLHLQCDGKKDEIKIALNKIQYISSTNRSHYWIWTYFSTWILKDLFWKIRVVYWRMVRTIVLLHDGYQNEKLCGIERFTKQNYRKKDAEMSNKFWLMPINGKLGWQSKHNVFSYENTFFVDSVCLFHGIVSIHLTIFLD